MRIPVFLARIPEYDPAPLNDAVARILAAAAPDIGQGMRVVVKPNLVTFSNAGLCCTHPLVVRAVCLHLLERGAQVRVADSPAFGSAPRVARAAGLDSALKDLGLTVHGLGNPVPLNLTKGGAISVSRDALDADMILNVPRFKAHRQMVLTGAVKNLFGCVCGLRKVMAHNRFGDDPQAFRSMIMDVALSMPPTLTVLDAIVPMHVSGPVNGEPFRLSLLAACADPVGLDTFLYTLLGLAPTQVPLWQESVDRGLDGSDADALDYPMEQPGAFDATGFTLPATLMDLHFNPLRILWGRLSNLVKRMNK